MIRGWRFRLRALFRSRAVERELDDEIRDHLDREIAARVARGMSYEEARRTALVDFGGVERFKEECRDESGARPLMDLWSDFAYAVRSLGRDPGLTATVVVTLALGIGANAVMYGVIDRLLLSGPPHVHDLPGLVRYFATTRSAAGEFTSPVTNWATYTNFRDDSDLFEDLAAYRYSEETDGRGSDARLVNVGYSSASLFPLLGVRPALGRFYDEAEVDADAMVVVLSYGVWQREYGGDPGVLGQTIRFAGSDYTVIGVTPRGFTGPEFQRADMWFPASAGFVRQIGSWRTTQRAFWLGLIGRLGDGVSRELASEQATSVYHAGFRAAGLTPREGSTAAWLPMTSDGRGREGLEARIALWLGGVSLVLFLIACFNVANLLLARSISRRREVAVRLAIGAARLRLARMLFVESTVLALVAAVAGLALVPFGRALVWQILIPELALFESGLTPRVFAVAGLAALMTIIMITALPLAQALGADLTRDLRAGTRQGGGQRSRTRVALTIAQTAMSTLLLVGAGLFVASLRRATGVDLGIEQNQVLSVSFRGALAPGMDFRSAQVLEDAFHQQVVERLSGSAAFESVSIAAGSPLGNGFIVDLRADGVDSIPEMEGGGPWIHAVTPSHLETLGMRMIEGRFLAEADRTGPLVAVVNETMARTLWAGRDVIGRCLYMGDGGECTSIVGIVADTPRSELREPPAMQYYIYLGRQEGFSGSELFVRPRGDAVAAVELLRAELLAIRPDLPYLDIAPLANRLEPHIRPFRLGATMFSLFGALALITAAVGLYGVIAFGVAQRTHELGVRIALGARGSRLIRMVVGSGLSLTGLGMTIGVVLSLIGGRFVAPLLFDVSPTEPAVFATLILTMLVTALAASLVPALRAARVDPMVALRVE